MREYSRDVPEFRKELDRITVLHERLKTIERLADLHWQELAQGCLDVGQRWHRKNCRTCANLKIRQIARRWMEAA